MTTRVLVSVFILGISLAAAHSWVDEHANQISAFFSTGEVIAPKSHEPQQAIHIPQISVPIREPQQEDTPEGASTPTAQDAPSLLEPVVPDHEEIELRRLMRDNPGKQIGRDDGGYFVMQGGGAPIEDHANADLKSGTAGEERSSARSLLSENHEMHMQAVHPRSGPLEGLSITITGGGFISDWFKRTDCRCQFGNNVSEFPTVVLNSTHISCRAPRLSVGKHAVALVVTSTATLLHSPGLEFSAFPSLLVADRSGNQILRFNALNGAFSDVFVVRNAGGLLKPSGMGFESNKHLLVASEGTSAVLQYDGGTGGYIRKFCTVRTPRSMTVHASFLYVASSHSHSVYMFSALTGSPKGVYIARSSGLLSPWGVLFNKDTAHAYVSSTQTNRIHRYSTSADERAGSANSSSVWSQVDVPHAQGMALTVDSLYAVGPFPGQAFARFNRTTGEHLQTFTDEELSSPVDVREFNDYVYIASNEQVRKYNRLNGELIRVHAHYSGAVASSLLFHQHWQDQNGD